MILRLGHRLTPRLAGLLFAIAACSATAAEAEHEPSAAVEEAGPGPETTKAEAKAPDPEAAQKALCELIETSAKERDLPVGFFTRLIWAESRFRHDAVSPKGAQGIAQFMPGTADDRGLDDPFDVKTAIPASAHLLFDLERRFGNLGLAAAAYNAGETRVHNWLAEIGTLPYETRNYVLSITGVPVETWADSNAAPKLPTNAESETDCLALAKQLRKGSPLAPDIETVRAPWGVQIAGGYSRARVIDSYRQLISRFASVIGDRPPMVLGGRMPGRGTRAFYRARVPVQTRAEGEKLCAALKKKGGSCVVLKT